MDLSIVIVNYNTNKYSIDCIQSIYDQTSNLMFEVLVVDNNSKKEDPCILKEAFPKITLIKNEENMGFGIANNLGIGHATGKYILLLNSDTIILEKALEKCVGFMNSEFAIESNIGLMGCTLLNSDSSFQHSTFSKSHIGKYLINSNPILSKLFGSNSTQKFNYEVPQFVEGLSGAFMLFRREVFDKIKPFDPDLFMYSEETELCRNRLTKHFKVYYWPEAKIIHHGGKSGLSEIMHKQNMLSYALTWYKRGIGYYLIYLLISTFNFFTYLLTFPFSKNRSHKKIIYGYFAIFNQLIFDIPKYGRGWGSRPSPLKLNKLKQ